MTERSRRRLLADFRFGWFEYNVNVLPFDFGTTPAADAGIPGLNLDTTFTSGLPALFIGGDGSTSPSAFEAGSGLGVNRCNCPLDQDEKQWQVVGNLTKLWATTASSSASTSVGPTTCACRRTSTARAS